jgi:hypothetical protein
LGQLEPLLIAAEWAAQLSGHLFGIGQAPIIKASLRAQ